MASVRLHTRDKPVGAHPSDPLPQLIQTPAGIAILELQGTINLPSAVEDTDASAQEGLPVGRIQFPDHNPDLQDPSSTSWMKRVHMFVGQNQRLTGEVKKLPKPWAVVRRKSQAQDQDATGTGAGGGVTTDDLEIVEIVKYKLLFSHRPEPVGTT